VKTLLLGASGQLGSAVVAAWPKAMEWPVSESAPYYSLMTPTHAQLDVTNVDAVDDFVVKHQPKVIINCAAWTSVDGCEKAPERADRVNHLGAANVAHAASTVGAHLIHISTDACETEPRSVYAKTKDAAEKAVLSWRNGNATILRLSCILSKHRNGWLSFVVRSGLKRLQPRVSCQIMAPVLVESIVAAIFHAIEHHSVGTFSVMDSPAVSRYRMASVALHAAGCLLSPQEVPPDMSGAPRRIDSIMTTPMLIKSEPWEPKLRMYVFDVVQRELLDVG
jgi:dTDP-4-dehydrorhamnose reductase